MKKAKTMLVALLFFCISLFVVFTNNTYASELKYVAMEQTANNLFLADRDQGKIYVFNNDNKGTLNKIITVGGSPTSMVVYNNYLLVALSQANQIKIINTVTLTEVGEITTSKMPYWLALDGNKLYSTVSRNNGTDYYPFITELSNSNNSVVASSTVVWPTTYPNFYMNGNEHIIVNPVTHTAYIGNLGYSPDNIKKYDTSDINNIKYLMQSDHGSLGSNGQQFIFNEDYSKIYFSASGADGYTMQIVNSANLAKIADLSLGSYPNSVAYDSSYIYAGKSAYYDSGDIKVYDKASNIFVKDYNLPDNENLLSRGISSGANIYAASNKNLYLLDKNSSKVTAIYDFVNNKVVDNTLKDGDLIKMEGSSAIFQLNNNKRDVVPSGVGFEAYKGAILNSRSLNESGAKVISTAELTSYPLNKNLTVKPNANYLLKKQNQERYFLVSSEATLTEVDKNNYSNYFLITIPDVFFSNYSINEEIAPSYSINVSKTGTGSGTVFEGYVLEMGSVINCGSKCSASFLPNAQTITLTASPVDGSVFTSWTGCGSNTTNPVCTVQINENKNIVANFSAVDTSPATKDITISLNTGSSEMKSSNTAYIAWSVNVEPEYCGIDYGLNSNLSEGTDTNGSLVQRGLATNDGQFYYIVNLTNLQSNKDYYYKVVCTLKGASTVYQSDVKKLSKYGTVNSLPDIVADSASIFDGTNENKTLSVAPKAGEKFYLWLAYKNIGEVKTNNTAFYINVYIDDVFSKKLKASNNDYLSDLGSSMGVDEKLELALKEGSHKIKFVLDVDNNIKESNEGNNVYIKEIKIGGVKTSDVVADKAPLSDGTTQLVLQLQRKISELESKVIELEKKATQLDQKFANKYAGTMFLDVQNQGRLWYVDPASKNRFYFENGEAALSIGSKLATGISYEDIQKIPVGVPDKLYNLKDSDGDGLPDNLETALGLNPNKADTDGDGIDDKTELNNGYNPSGSQKYIYDKALTARLEGKMLLQVSGPNSHGEIWYIHDGKRWYGGTQDSMYEIMKAMSLGAVPENIRKITVGEVSGTE